MKKALFFLCLLLLLPARNFSQVHEDSTQRGLGKVVVPVVFYTPETRFGAGAAGMLFWRFPNVDPKTRLSSVQFLMHYTQERQVLAKFPFELHFDQNRHIFKGSVTAFRYGYLFYGIGPDAPFSNEELYTTSSLWVRADYLYQMYPNLFLGLHYRLDYAWRVQAEDPDGLIAEGTLPGSNGGAASGFGAVVSYDRRDNIFNPSVGPLFETSLTLNRPWTGSQFDFVRWELDARHYFQLPRHQLLGVHVQGDVSWGEVPFESMGLLGHFTINRGYYEGRYRDQAMLSMQAEHRIPIYRGDGPRETLPWYRRFGVVMFGGLGQVGPSLSAMSVENVKYSYGAGLRFLFHRKENVTIRIDYGRGLPGNDGVYFMVGEAF